MQISKWIAIAMFLSRKLKYLIVCVVIFVLVFILTITWGTTAFGQPRSPLAQNNDLPIANLFNGSGQIGNIVYMPVELDGRPLFHIAAEVGTSAEDASSDFPIAMRVNMYEENLYKIIQTGFDPETLQVRVSNRKGQLVIFATDRDRLLDLLTVTELDARLHGLPVSDLAEQFTQIIKEALIRARLERQPEYLQTYGMISTVIFLAAIAVSFALQRLQKRLQARWDVLIEDPPAPIAFEEIPTDAMHSQILADRDRLMNVERQRDLNALKRRLLQIGQFLLWVAALAWITGLFPWTRWLESWLLTKPVILLIILLTSFAIKAIHVTIDRGCQRLIESQTRSPRVSQRLAVRFSTFSQVLKGIATFSIAGIGILLVLYKLHVPIAPILAGAGIVGFAVSFASQNFIRDVINGSFILLEDQYAIGDVIDVGNANGVVEYLNLRITQVRGAGGRLSTIPNSSITVVHNLTKEWSRIDFTVEIGYDADLVKAIDVVKAVAEQLKADSEWGDRILDPAKILGVNNIAHTGIEIIIWIETQPGLQWSVGREFRRRLKLAFDEAGIAIGMPQRSLWFENHPNGKGRENSTDGQQYGGTDVINIDR